MKLLVTVGTTAFDELVSFIDQEPFFDNFEVTIQYGPGQYIPKNRKYFAFTKNIEEEYLAADFVISHGGAGTVYKLLELCVPLCVVPNLERIDDHQLDICEHLSSLKHVLYAKHVTEIPKRIQEFSDGKIQLIKFEKQRFFLAKDIAYYLIGE